MTGRRPLILATVALVGAALALPGPAAASTWLAPATVSAPDRDASPPQLAIDGRGTVTAVWSTSVSVHAASRPAGGEWTAAAEIYSGAPIVMNPRLAVNARGDAIAIWECGDNVLRASVRPSGSGAWLAPREVAPGYEPRIALDPAGNATAVWAAYKGSGPVVQAASRRWGEDWTSPVDLSGPNYNSWPDQPSQDPRIAIDGRGDALAIWTQTIDRSTAIVRAARKSAARGIWQGSVDVASAGAGVELAVNAHGDAVAVWQKPGFVIQAARAGAGGSWEPPVDLSRPGRDNVEPSVAIDPQGAAVATWMSIASADDEVVQAAVMPPGGAWEPPAAVSRPAAVTTFDSRPVVAAAGTGKAVAVWTRYDGTELIAQSAEHPRGGAWTAPVDVSQRGAHARDPAVAADGEGNAAAAWNRMGWPSVAQVAGLDGAGPSLYGLVIPSSATAGVPVTLSVAPLDVWSALGSVTWDYGDGAVGEGPSVTHTYARAATFTVTLTSRDALGQTTSAAGQITVAPADAPSSPALPTLAPSPAPAARSPLTGLTRVAKRLNLRPGRITVARAANPPIRSARVTLTARRRTIASGQITLLARQTRAVRITLTAQGRQLRRGPLRATLTIAVRGTDGTRATLQRTVTVTVTR